MSGNSSSQTLYVFWGSTSREICSITTSNPTLTLQYADSWVVDGFPISPHLPFHKDIEHEAIRDFIGNLLPEGVGLDELVSHTGISRNDVFELIKVIGMETSGALSFRTERNSPERQPFRMITKRELGENLESFKLDTKPLTIWDGEPILSVAGVQAKLNLIKINDCPAIGFDNQQSNKIFKFEADNLPFIAVNEMFTMTLARLSGLNTPPVHITNFGANRAFIIERFDRYLCPIDNAIVSRHVIDGCQATNLPSAYKYERQYGDDGDGAYMRDGVSFKKLLEIEVTNPDLYKLQLIQWMTFNIITKNYDAHGKNISFIVSKNGLELAPFYDLVNIEALTRSLNITPDVYANREQSTPQYFAMSIGEYEPATAGNFERPTAYMLADFAMSVGINPEWLQTTMTTTVLKVIHSLSLAKAICTAHDISTEEALHIDRCIDVMKNEIADLLLELNQIKEMSDFL